MPKEEKNKPKCCQFEILGEGLYVDVIEEIVNSEVSVSKLILFLMEHPV